MRCFSDISDLVAFLSAVCVFQLALRAEVITVALAVGVFCMRVRHVLVWRVCACVWRLCPRVHHLVHPAPEAADSGVERRRGGVAAAVTPGDHPDQDPPTRLLLAQQPPSGVSLTAVVTEEAGVWRTASAQGAVAGVAVAIALLALP